MPALPLIHVVLPARKRDAARPPLLVLLHGVGSNERDLMGLAPELDQRFLIVSARAPINLGASSYAWFHVQFTAGGPVIDPGEADSSRIRLLQFLAGLPDAYDADAQRLYLMGFSQGCIMSMSAALTSPRLFAGVAAMSGRILPEVRPRTAPRAQLLGLPVLWVHGTNDEILPLSYSRAARRRLEELAVDLDYREYKMGHAVSPASFADVKAWLTARLDDPRDWRKANTT
ncbi:MAG: carboxylesterase [Acidobacteria bacterium]|nr:carboxylesterase [Acidobacteriota bacterium]